MGSTSFSWSMLEHAEFRWIILHLRLPRVLAAMLSGAALALAGLILQTLFQNPMAGPFVLGIASGALSGPIILLLLGILPSMLQLILGSFVGAMAMTALIVLIASFISNRQVLLLIGLMMGYFFSGLINILIFFAPSNELKNFQIWSMGSFSRVTMDNLWVLGGMIILLIAVSFLFIKPLNAFMMGHDYAVSIGIDSRWNRRFLLLISSLLTAVVTAFCGPIGFIGLTAPHIGRFWLKTSYHQYLIPVSCLLGANMLCLCDIVARVLIPPNDLPIGLITSILGAPLVIWFLWRVRFQ